MKQAVQLAFDYAALDADTRAFVQERAAAIHRLARATAAAIVQIGQMLTEVKERLGHGKFQEWIRREFAWTIRHAQNFMLVYREFKNENFSHLEIDASALFLIAKPSTPEPVRVEAIRRAELGEKVTHSVVRNVVTEYQKSGDASVAVSKLFDVVRQAKVQEADDKRRLPSPAEARQKAIESGAHTLDWNGNYQPPMTKEAQAEWRADMRRLGPLWDFLRWVASTDNPDPTAAVQLIESRHWRRDFTPYTRNASAWLKDFSEALWREKKQTS